MQQIERKGSEFSLHGKGSSKTNCVSSTSKHSARTSVGIPVIPGATLRTYFQYAPVHIQQACCEMMNEYRKTYTAVSERSLLQYVISDLLNPALPLTPLHRMLASGSETPGEVLEELRHCGHRDVLERIAENRNTREETLLELACDSDPEVRGAVAENPRTPVIALWQLSVDPCEDVRYRQAESLHTPLRILVRHLTDENPYISHRARKTLTMHGLPTSLE